MVNKFKIVEEGLSKVKVPVHEKVSKEMVVFYNPVMVLNRDLSTLVLRAVCELNNKNDLQIALPLAGSGIRACRFIQELPKQIRFLSINDYSKDACKLIKENLKKNKTKENKKIKITISNNEASKFLLDGLGFDYIDVDPFGTPNPFLDASIKRISREGILAVTATDTSALSGTYELAGKRKYWGSPMRNSQMHEVGLRLLIRKVQLLGAQYEKALIPVYSLSEDHYMKIFFLCKKGKKEVDNLLKLHKYFHYCDSCLSSFSSEYNKEECVVCKFEKEKKKNKETRVAGPVFVGKLFDEKLANKISELAEKLDFIDKKTKRITAIIAEEAKFKGLGFFRLNDIAKKFKITNVKKELLKKKGFFPTHLEPNAIKCASISLLVPKFAKKNKK